MPRASADRPPPYDAAAAVELLGAADAKLRRLMERAGPCTLRISGAQSPFEALAESIVFQQLHGKAARAIHTRMVEGFADTCGVGVHPSAQNLLDCPTTQLREAGLSHNKTLALRDLARQDTGRHRADAGADSAHGR